MKRLGLVLLLALVLASPAMAGQIQIGYPGSAYGPFQYDRGGEFTFNPLGGWLDTSLYGSSVKNIGVAGTFQTFCIEVNEYINDYPDIYNAQLNTRAMFGSVGAGGDPVSKGTGWLYSQFARGTLAGYSYGGTLAERKNSADALQRTFWWLEEEPGYGNPGNAFSAAVLAQFGNSETAARAAGAENYGVYAINLWTGSDPNSNRAQDGLLYVPDGGATVALLGCALMCLAALRRKV